MRLTPGAGQIPQARKASVVRASVAEEKTHELDNTHRTERAHRRRTGRALRPDLKGVCSSRASVPGMARRDDIARQHPSRAGEASPGHTPIVPRNGFLIPRPAAGDLPVAGPDSSRERWAALAVCGRLILARQQDRVVGEVEADFVEWEVGKFDRLGEHDAIVPVIARQDAIVSGEIDAEFPDLEFLRRDSRNGLPEGDLVDQPVGARGVEDVFDAVGENDLGDQRMAIPVLAAHKLREVALVQCGARVHGAPPAAARSSRTALRITRALASTSRVESNISSGSKQRSSGTASSSSRTSTRSSMWCWASVDFARGRTVYCMMASCC